MLVASQIFNLHISSSSNLFCVGIQLVLLFGCDLDILFAPCLVEMLWLVLTLWYGVQLRSLMCWDSTVGSLVKMDSLELTMNLAKIGLIQSVSLWINSIEVVGFFVCVCVWGGIDSLDFVSVINLCLFSGLGCSSFSISIWCFPCFLLASTIFRTEYALVCLGYILFSLSFYIPQFLVGVSPSVQS